MNALEEFIFRETLGIVLERFNGDFLKKKLGGIFRGIHRDILERIQGKLYEETIETIPGELFREISEKNLDRILLINFLKNVRHRMKTPLENFLKEC